MPDARADVVVIGGGPAGAAFALSLLAHRPQARVVIVERGAYATDKVGESLPPIAGSLLRQLGVWDAFCAAGHRPSHGTAAAWGSAQVSANEFAYGVHGHGWHLDRRRFDRELAAAAAARGASLLTETKLEGAAVRGTASGYELELAGPSGRRTITTELVIDASGRAASFARRHGGELEVVDRLIGIVGHVSLSAPLSDSYTLVEARPDGWCYSAELPAGTESGTAAPRLLVAAMTDADLARAHELREPQRWLKWLRGGELTAARLAHATPEAAPEPTLQVVAAGSQRLRSAVGPDWLAIGDAASSYDPLSSQGIVKALRGGIFGAYAVLDHLAGQAAGWDRYAGIVAREFDFYLAKHKELHAREQRWPEREFWRRRHVPFGQHLRTTTLTHS